MVQSIVFTLPNIQGVCLLLIAMQKAMLVCTHNTCSYVKLLFIGPPALSVNIMKNIESSSIVVQWVVVDDLLPTIYTIVWGDRIDQSATVDEQTSYTITGLNLDTVYTL